MIFGKQGDGMDFDAFKKDVNAAAEPLVEAVKNYDPNKKKRSNYKTATADLPHEAGLFFSAAAEALGKKNFNPTNSEEENDSSTVGDKLKGLRLDKVADNATKTVKDAKLDKKLGKVTDNIGSTVKDAKLDKKLGGAVDTVSTAFLGAANAAGNTVKDAKLDKKFGELTGNVGNAVKDAKLDKKFGDFTSNASSTFKDAKLDKKLGDVAHSLSDSVKDARLDKKLAGIGVAAAPLATTVADGASSLVDGVSHFVKDNKLDKKASDAIETAGDALTAATDWAGDAFKGAKLDKKLGDTGKRANKALEDAHLPELFFGAANSIPGVNVGNPKKAAKAFRKQRAQALKAVSAQQKELGKVLSQSQKDAGKYIKARQKDIDSGKIRVPFVEPKKQSSPWGSLGLVLGGAGLAYGGLAANNARIWSATPPLESKLPGTSNYYRSRQGLVFYKQAGEGKDKQAPVVFVHGIGAGNHSYEWMQNFGPISEQYKSYAYDLLGFGNSDKPELRYTAEVYIKQLTEFLDDVVGQPAYVIASSLGAAYAVQVAYRRPELIKKLVLVSPTGSNPKRGGKDKVQVLPEFTYFLLRAPVLGKAIYSSVASQSGIRSFMENQMLYDKSLVRDEMVQQYHTAAHQPGAHYAPPSFFTGLLNAEIGQTLAKLNKPVLMFFGKESQITPPHEAEALKRQNPTARLEMVDRTRLLVQWERAEEINRMALEFLAQPDQEVSATTLKPSSTTGVGLGETGSTERTAEPKADKGSEVLEQVKKTSGALADELKELVNEPGQKVEQVKEAAEKLTQAQKTETKGQSKSKNQEPTEAVAHFTQQAGAEDVEAATEASSDRDLAKELREHREAFIGDSESGAALLEDKDGNNVDERRMGPLG